MKLRTTQRQDVNIPKPVPYGKYYLYGLMLLSKQVDATFSLDDKGV